MFTNSLNTKSHSGNIEWASNMPLKSDNESAAGESLTKVPRPVTTTGPSSIAANTRHPNIIILEIDSMSTKRARRTMPRTWAFL